MTPDTVLARLDDQGDRRAAAMQLVEQGKLALDAPIGTLLPQLADAHGARRLRPTARRRCAPPRRAITLRHLHDPHGGLPTTPGTRSARYIERTGLPAARTGLNKALSAPLGVRPASASIRHQHRLGRQGGRSGSLQRLDVYLEAHILAPRMRDTVSLERGAARRRVAVHSVAPTATLTPISFETAPDPVPRRRRRAVGTAPDYIRFVRMLLNGGALDGARVSPPRRSADRGGPHRRSRLQSAAHARCPLRPTTGLGPGSIREMGPELPDEPQPDTGGPQRREPRLGGSPTPRSGSIPRTTSAA